MLHDMFGLVTLHLKNRIKNTVYYSFFDVEMYICKWSGSGKTDEKNWMKLGEAHLGEIFK